MGFSCNPFLLIDFKMKMTVQKQYQCFFLGSIKRNNNTRVFPKLSDLTFLSFLYKIDITGFQNQQKKVASTGYWTHSILYKNDRNVRSVNLGKTRIIQFENIKIWHQDNGRRQKCNRKKQWQVSVFSFNKMSRFEFLCAGNVFLCPSNSVNS